MVQSMAPGSVVEAHGWPEAYLINTNFKSKIENLLHTRTPRKQMICLAVICGVYKLLNSLPLGPCLRPHDRSKFDGD